MSLLEHPVDIHYTLHHNMASPDRERLAKQLLQGHIGSSGEPIRRASKPTSAKPKSGVHGSQRPAHRHKHLHRLPSPTEEQLERREQGWNDRFSCETPSQPKRPTRVHRRSNDGGDLHDQEERKIRDERQQYGHGDAPKHQRPNVGRLVPIVPLSNPPKEPEVATSKEEKLRFNVLKAIDARETLIYQLNALILCTPVQEATVMAAPRVSRGSHPQIKPKATMALAPAMSSSSAKGSVSAMSNAREAMRLAQQLGADLQVSGIQVVEGIVEWMLEAGAKAEKPPEFVWRGRNYFIKMHSDLDFAGPELYARGVELDCFTVSNALCIRPDQKLGRVLAAQAIILEMVEMARSQVAKDEKLKLTGRDQTVKSGRRAGSRKLPSPADAEILDSNETESTKNVVQHHVGADEMIAASTPADDYEDDGFISARPDAASIPPGQRDLETEKELVNILDDSFCETSVRANVDTVSSSDTMSSSVKLSERSTKSSAREEYENSFDNEDDEEPLQLESVDAAGDHARVVAVETSQLSRGPEVNNEVQPNHKEIGLTVSADTDFTERNEPEKDSGGEVVWDRAAVSLQRFAPLGRKVSGASLRDCIAWITAHSNDLREAVEKALWLKVQEALDSSLLHVFASTWENKEAIESMVTCMKSEQELLDIKLSHHVWDECIVLLDEVCGGIAHTIERGIVRISPLVSEVDISDVMEAAENALDNDAGGVLRCVGKAANALLQLRPTRGSKSTPPGLSRLVRVFYPYLVNQRRDKLVHRWGRIESMFAGKWGVKIEDLSFLLDSPGKILLLNVECLRRISQEESEDDPVPKLTIVCDRQNVSESSRQAVMKKCSAANGATKQLPSYQIFPFFESSFGEKVVDGVRVEEGEGKGPLKEWFALLAAELTVRWAVVELSVASSDDYDPVLVNGNKLVVDRLDRWIKPGFKVEWRSPADGTTVSRIINKCDTSTGAYMLDRGGISNHSFNVSELKIYKPRTAYLEYIQPSESYWLNEVVIDTPENRKMVEFVGWFLANALVHQCALQIRLHNLLFDLLLDPKRTITLQDLELLDPSLHTAIEQLQYMKPAEFASYLEFEGASPSLSVDDYTAQTIDQKYGAQSNIAWQLEEMRRGFYRVFTYQDLHHCNVTAVDLTDQLHGDAQDTSDNDFAISKVFRVSLDPDFASCQPLQKCFWDAVNGFDPKLKRKLLKFITGVDTLPQAGTEFLRIEMPFPALSPAECDRTLRMLPQSHTCDNTLELPHYWRALCWKLKHDADQPSERLEMELTALLREKLSLVAEYSSGYGLDGTKATGSSLAGLLPGSLGARSAGSTLDVQDSYESLDVPGLGGDSTEDAGESRIQAAPPQADEPLPLETTDMRQSAKPTEMNAATTACDEPGEEVYEADEWDVEEEALDG